MTASLISPSGFRTFKTHSRESKGTESRLVLNPNRQGFGRLPVVPSEQQGQQDFRLHCVLSQCTPAGRSAATHTPLMWCHLSVDYQPQRGLSSDQMPRLLPTLHICNPKPQTPTRKNLGGPKPQTQPSSAQLGRCALCLRPRPRILLRVPLSGSVRVTLRKL